MDGLNASRPMTPEEIETRKQMMEDAFKNMKQAFVLLSSPSSRSRENSLVLTKLEEAMMWCNKDRTIRGHLEPNKDTHVSQVK